MPLHSLPTEILQHVSQYLGDSDLDNVVKTCRHTYHVFNRELGSRAVRHNRFSCREDYCCRYIRRFRGCRYLSPISRALTDGDIDAVRRFIEARIKFSDFNIRAALEGRVPEIMDLLAENGVPLDVEDVECRHMAQRSILYSARDGHEKPA